MVRNLNQMCIRDSINRRWNIYLERGFIMAIVNKNPEYFLTIAKEGNISKAAEILYVSQSYLSQYISKLESSFDVKLFDRSKVPIELTEAGRIYYNYLQASNQLYSKLTSDFDALTLSLIPISSLRTIAPSSMPFVKAGQPQELAYLSLEENRGSPVTTST